MTEASVPHCFVFVHVRAVLIIVEMTTILVPDSSSASETRATYVAWTFAEGSSLIFYQVLRIMLIS